MKIFSVDGFFFFVFNLIIFVFVVTLIVSLTALLFEYLKDRRHCINSGHKEDFVNLGDSNNPKYLKVCIKCGYYEEISEDTYLVELYRMEKKRSKR